MTATDVSATLRRGTDAIRSATVLDNLTEPATRLINDVIDRSGWRNILSGTRWLGHPLHPALTDLPIGFWTSAFVLDFLGGKKSKRAATLMVLSGIATAVPTAASGAHDFTELDEEKKRVGMVHAVSNSIALLFYIGSFFARVRGRRGRGVYLGVLGAAAATVGGYLGGHLVFGASHDDDATDTVPKPDERHATPPNGNGRQVVTSGRP